MQKTAAIRAQNLGGTLNPVQAATVTVELFVGGILLGLPLLALRTDGPESTRSGKLRHEHPAVVA